MHFEITRAFRHGQQMTRAQKSSSLFSPEPVVMGKALRRGMPPLRISEAQFHQNQIMLKRLFDAGSIDIKAVDEGKVVDFREAAAKEKMSKAIPRASDELETMQKPAEPVQAMAGDPEPATPTPAGESQPAGVDLPPTPVAEQVVESVSEEESHRRKGRGKKY